MQKRETKKQKNAPPIPTENQAAQGLRDYCFKKKLLTGKNIANEQNRLLSPVPKSSAS